MAMNSAALTTALLNRFKVAWRTPSGGAGNTDAFLTNLASAIAQEVVNHIVTNAQCTGVDSHGDTHDSVGVR